MRNMIKLNRYFGKSLPKNHRMTWEEAGGYPDGYDPKVSNLTPRIWSLTKRKLYKQPNHPVSIIKKLITNYFDSKVKSYAVFPIRPTESFELLEDLSCVVTVHQCFDVLNVPLDHISRSKSDTYYINKDTILRAQTSAHQVETMLSGLTSFLVFGKINGILGDVYRRDEINQTHYPGFHQMEGVRLFTTEELGTNNIVEAKKIVENDLKRILEGLAK